MTPLADSVEIVEQGGFVYLLRLDRSGECFADTWHESVDAAKSHAQFEYGIAREDWVESR